MRLLTASFVILAACGPSPALEAPRTPQVSPASAASPGELPATVTVTSKSNDPLPRSPDRGFDGDPGGRPEVEVPSLERSCELRRDRLAKFRAELADLQSGHAEWVAKHCQPTLKYYTRKTIDGAESSRGPERAWVCDGKIVDSTESSRGLYLAQRIADLQVFLREKCDDHRGF